MTRIDLHSHSTASDGSDAPADLVRKAHALGLAALALTDHDTLAGLDEGEAAAEECGLEFIRGCELSARGERGELHILGLWIPGTHPELENFECMLRELRERRDKRNRTMTERLNALGCRLDYEEVLAEARGESVGRPHIAAALLRKGYAKSAEEIFNRWLGSKGSAYEPKQVLQPEEAVRHIAALGATVALAHPRLGRHSDVWLDATARELTAHGLSAVEAYHSEHSEADTRFCTDLAARHGLALCGGSDYHGKLKPDIRLGTGKGGLRIPLGILEHLKAERRKLGLPM